MNGRGKVRLNIESDEEDLDGEDEEDYQTEIHGILSFSILNLF